VTSYWNFHEQDLVIEEKMRARYILHKRLACTGRAFNSGCTDNCEDREESFTTAKLINANWMVGR